MPAAIKHAVERSTGGRLENIPNVGRQYGCTRSQRSESVATTPNYVALLKAKSITLTHCKEAPVPEAPSSFETYLYLAAYRVLFQRHVDGTNKNKFVKPDFDNLSDVNALDETPREAFRMSAKDIERVKQAYLLKTEVTFTEENHGIAPTT